MVALAGAGARCLRAGVGNRCRSARSVPDGKGTQNETRARFTESSVLSLVETAAGAQVLPPSQEPWSRSDVRAERFIPAPLDALT